MTCPECGNDLPGSALSCPQCRALVHAAKLQDLAQRAQAAWRLGHFAEECTLWREAMLLLRHGPAPHDRRRVEEIERMLGAQTASAQTGWKKASVGIGPMVLLLLGKGKFLLLGLTKIGTLLTMFASLGAYWAMYGARQHDPALRISGCCAYVHSRPRRIHSPAGREPPTDPRCTRRPREADLRIGRIDRGHGRLLCDARTGMGRHRAFSEPG
jgi:hypothetical protein